MLPRIYQKCLLRPEDVQPSHPGLAVVSVFNPGVALYNDEVVMLVRVAEKPTGKFPGYVGSPRWTPELGVVIDWIPENDVVLQDPRVMYFKDTGNIRLTFISHLRVIRSKDGRSVDSVEDTAFSPQNEEEEYGIEDPRITRIGDTWYFTYVSVSRHGACTSLASTQNFRNFKRHGIILAAENKDVLLFPEKISDKYAVLHRPNPRYHFTPPEMWYGNSPDLVHWGQHRIVGIDSTEWEAGRTGGGVPPIKTPYGWLEIYHASTMASNGEVGQYVAGALMLDTNEPWRVVGRSVEPVLVPEADFEREGFVENVVFPTGLVKRNDVFQIFYGAADAYTGMVELDSKDILSSICCIK